MFREIVFKISDEVERIVERMYEENFFTFSIEEEEEGTFLKIYLNPGEDIPDFLRGMNLEFVQEKEILPSDWLPKDLLKPFEVAPNLVVDPSDVLEDEKRIVIKLTPGLAFGTGYHPTTRMALSFIVENIKNGMTFLDVGCGTGILSIAAKKLGAGKVLAVDIDPQAVEIAIENALRNDVKIDVLESNLLEKVKGKYDMIAANILPEILLELLEDVHRVSHNKTILILSGITEEKEKILLDRARSKGWTLADKKVEDDWICFLMKRSSKSSLGER
ncbi:MAG: 50S ribosomal protein L11 methyltransferase [Thermotogaceae bacterium]|nr:50S ribosomal protein L11 methyltransferase [Thermotogaceae bacterium]